MCTRGWPAKAIGKGDSYQVWEDPILVKNEGDLGGILTCVKCNMNILDVV